MSSEPTPSSSGPESFPHRYSAALAGRIEALWQDRWDLVDAYRAPNPGEAGFDGSRPKKFVLDMFPYPSGVGLHVGHPLGYIATDIYARYLRMTGHNVVHAMGFDSFGLPAEQYAVQTGTHPRITTEKNIANMRVQLRRLGLGHERRRSVSTTDPDFYRWTQWIFLQIYHAWYDVEAGRARPIRELEAMFASGERAPRGEKPWSVMSALERASELDAHRLAYVDEVPVNWCPMLGTVLANEEVTADGRSERGNYPVYRRPLKQWIMRITAYAERLLKDLEPLDWPEPIKLMQRNWIGRSEGAEVEFDLGSPPLRGGSLDDIAHSAERRELRAASFVGRDPYPDEVYGPARDVTLTRRNLPHLSMPGATYFVTWKTLEGVELSDAERDVAMGALRHFDGVRCEVYAATVMSNHIHWIVRPLEGQTLEDLVRSVKKFSATEINKSRGASGHVWQAERFDHIIRDVGYFNDFIHYCLMNPVEAGVVERASGYRWSFVGSGVGRVDGGAELHPATEWRGTRKIRVFTTRPDTLFGATYVVLSPEHALVDAIVPQEWPAGGAIPAPWRGTFPGAPQGGFTSPKNAVAAYRAYASKKSDEQRTGDGAEKTGVFTGAYAINPVTGKQVPIFIADYVLAGYGTGAIMAVPAHDDRDFEFARVLKLPIRDVVYSRPIAAMRYFAMHAYPTGEAAPDWREQLADFMGITTSNASKDEAWDVMLPIVLNRRSRAGAMRGVELDAPGSIGERRGAVRSIWVETIDALGLRSFDDLRARFEEARFWESRGEAHTEPGIAANSSGPSITIDGMTTGAAKHAVGEWLAREGVGRPTVTFKLRDWLFSRQRYWGEPFPIVYDEWGRAHALPESMLPVLLPDLEDFRPESSEDPNAPPRPPLARASAWTTVELDLGDGKRTYTRETNTMPNWAGSCWYYLRYLDPTNQNALVGKDVDAYWMGGTSGKIGGVDLYVGGVEHAVLHLLYARFWHKVLFDLGHVSTAEPFQTLFNQGYIQAFAFKDARGVYVDAFEVRLPDGALAMDHQDKPGPYTYRGEPVTREYGKMGKSLKNAVAPDEICTHYGCDTMRIYEMAMGPLEASKPWNTRDIAGSFRFLQRVWRNLIDEQTGLSRVTQDAPTRATLRVLHKTIIGVRRDMEKLGFNTVVSKLIELNNHLSELPAVPLEAARAMILMLAPHAPHVSEELWHRVVRGGTPDEREARETIVHEAYPIADESLARDDEVEIPVSVLGKLRSKIVVPAGSSAAVIETAARADAKIAELIAGKEIKKVIVVPGKMVNFVL